MYYIDSLFICYCLSAQSLPNYVYVHLGKLLATCTKTILQPIVRRDFLQMIDVLRAEHGTPSHGPAFKVLRWWGKLGAIVGVTEKDLRAESRKALKRELGALAAQGCSWFKCVRYGDDCGHPLTFRCHGCQKHAYCGILCQTRCVDTFLPDLTGQLMVVSGSHWEEGGHKEECQARSNHHESGLEVW